MIANRFFKTTVGVPFELVIGLAPKALATYATFPSFVTGAIVGDYQAFADDKTKFTKGLTFGTALTSAQKKQMISLSYAVERSNGAATVITPTPLLGGSISATNVPYAAPTLQDSTITLASGTVQLNQELVFKIVETTPLNQNLPSYSYTQKVTTTLANAITAIVAAINAGAEGEFFTAVAGATSIQIVSTDARRHFRLAMDITPTRAFPINDTNWDVTATTPAFAGSGTVEQVRQLELESNIKRGVTTQYPSEGTAAFEYGEPVSMVDVLVAAGTTTFDVVVLTGVKTENSPTPIETHHNQAFLFVVVPAGQGAAVAATFA